ncbi:YdcF family protein [Caenimonas soli]|uniref:YdcF family protein n=1 Tax=Caenimonas soli TaxID=2735555 RepID=UPI001556ABD8|nr:YdcF family protein [Caenimonas soli]NPC56438.1 YdcF family protein [Caenimonas soli]
MAQAREHSAVIAVERLPAPVHVRRMLPLLCTIGGLLLVADAVVLMFLGVFSLGVTLPLAMGSVLLALGLRWDAVQAWLDASAGRRTAWRWIWLGVLAWIVTVAMFWSVLARAGHVLPVGDPPSAIVVLGSGTRGGKPTPALTARLDLALQQAIRYPNATVVVSGGEGFGQAVSEARVMGDYLRGKGFPAERIVQEEKSTSTEENLLFSKALLQRRGISPEGPVQLVTSDFHTLRAGWIAQRVGYTRASLAGAPTPLYVRYNAWLREYFAVLLGLVRREFG